MDGLLYLAGQVRGLEPGELGSIQVVETLRWDLTFLSAEMLVPPMPGDGKHPGLDVSLPTEGGNGPDHLHKNL